VPQALIDARSRELAALQALHQAVAERDPDATHAAAVAYVAAERERKARERHAFGGAQQSAG
jgi:hypothetical protein